MSSTSKRKLNTSVSTHFKLSNEDALTIADLRVRPGKLTAGKKKLSSGVWAYFGQLCKVNSRGPDQADQRDVSASSTRTMTLNNAVVIDDQLHYCSPCLEKLQIKNSSNVSEITSYSLATSTDSLRNHLVTVHNISRSIRMYTFILCDEQKYLLNVVPIGLGY